MYVHTAGAVIPHLEAKVKRSFEREHLPQSEQRQGPRRARPVEAKARLYAGFGVILVSLWETCF